MSARVTNARVCIVRYTELMARVIIHNHLIDKLAVINGFVSGVALYPQVFNVVTTGATGGLSAITLSLIFGNNIVWFLYAFHRLLISLMIAAALNLIASGVLLFLVLS